MTLENELATHSPGLGAQLGPMVPTMYRVVDRVEELPDTVTLALEPIGPPIDTPQPGQFNMLWAFGVGESPISLAAVESRRGDHRLFHTIRNVGAVTASLCHTEVGGSVGVRGPYGTGWALEQAKARDVLVVAGGLGVAPVRPIVEEILRRRDDFGRLAIVVGARSPDGLLYRPLLEAWAAEPGVSVELTVDAATPSWRGNVGLVTKLIDSAPVDLANAAVFSCGPEIMMMFVARTAIGLGTEPSRVQLSLERNMHCAIGHCGHCQLGPAFLCKDGPVLAWDLVGPLLEIRAR